MTVERGPGMAQWVGELVVQVWWAEIPSTHSGKRRRLPKLVLWLPHACCAVCVLTQRSGGGNRREWENAAFMETGGEPLRGRQQIEMERKENKWKDFLSNPNKADNVTRWVLGDCIANRSSLGYLPTTTTTTTNKLKLLRWLAQQKDHPLFLQRAWIQFPAHMSGGSCYTTPSVCPLPASPGIAFRCTHICTHAHK